MDDSVKTRFSGMAHTVWVLDMIHMKFPYNDMQIHLFHFRSKMEKHVR